MSLGGIHDEAEIRGHRRTYIGAMPGQIIQGIRRAEANDPVFMLDEIDKVGRDYRGDPTAALLEALDPEQNYSFRDNYLDVTFDLSKVLFITTANQLDTIPDPLRDRMEIIDLHGYTEEDKQHITYQYLIRRQTEENGLTPEQIEFTPDAVSFLIRHYTREAGVRSLERQIGTICRKQARRIVEGKTDKLVVTREVIQEMLGGIKVRVDTEIAARTKHPGVVVGLAWTPTGGDILFIEAMKMKGKGEFRITGQIQDVMRESMQAAFSWVRAHAEQLKIDDDVFTKCDLHIHVPAGAIPKDGPSAGVTIVTALVSLLTDKQVRPKMAMTGEITFSGNVLPIGGVKEKFLAAKRAGVTDIIFPAENQHERGRGRAAGADGGRQGALRRQHRGSAGNRLAAESGGSPRGRRSPRAGAVRRPELIRSPLAFSSRPALRGWPFCCSAGAPAPKVRLGTEARQVYAKAIGEPT